MYKESLIKVWKNDCLFSVFMDGVHELLDQPSYFPYHRGTYRFIEFIENKDFM